MSNLSKGDTPKKSWVSILISATSTVGWVLAIGVLLILDNAKPAGANFITNILGIKVPQYWNSTLLQAALIALIAVFAICLLGFAVNMWFYRKRFDRFNRSVIILGILSLVGIAVFLWRFGYML